MNHPALKLLNSVKQICSPCHLGLVWVGGPRPVNVAHGSDAIRKYSDFTLHRHYGVRFFSAGRIEDNMGNLEGLISWAGWCIRPHGGKSPCAVSQTFFKCESQCLWYETYRSGKGAREPSESSLPSFDKGMGKYPSFISRRNGITCLQLPSCGYTDSQSFIVSAREGQQGHSNSGIKLPCHVPITWHGKNK